LTCATPRAYITRPERASGRCRPMLPSLAARGQRSHLCMSSEPHTYLPRSSGCSKQPADVRVSRSPPDVMGADAVVEARGDAVDASQSLCPLSRRIPPSVVPLRCGTAERGVQEQILPTCPRRCQQVLYTVGGNRGREKPLPPLGERSRSD